MFGGRSQNHLANAAIGPSVLLLGKSLLEDDNALGRAVEMAFFRHVFIRCYQRGKGQRMPGSNAMDNRFFAKPIHNSPYEYPLRHWEFDIDSSRR